jgi:hypothetical protein
LTLNTKKTIDMVINDIAFIMVDSFCCFFTPKQDLYITHMQIEVNKISQFRNISQQKITIDFIPLARKAY